MAFKPTNEKIILEKINNALSILEDLKKDDYWSYTKEYWLGLLDGSILQLNKIKKDIE